jgi:hypothetical protein
MTDPNPFFDSFSNTDEENTTSESENSTKSEEIVASTLFMDNPFEVQETTFSSPKSNYGNSNNYSNNSGTAKKYYIRDNYWFVNMKMYRKEKLDPGEVSFVTISFNSQYDNMRIVFLNPSSDAFTDSAIIRSKCKVITTSNVFAETCEAILYYYDQSEEKVVPWPSFERLIQANSEWRPNRTQFELNKKDNKITIMTLPAGGNKQPLKFTFEEYQTAGFLNVCRFMRSDAWIVSNIGQFLINN